MSKTIVIGLDGANWNLLEPWILDGELRNLAFLIKNGVSGELQSELPTVTCPNWKCYSTGKNPGKFGVFWWFRVDKKKNRLVGYDSRSFKSLEIFDYLSRAGYRVGVINMPTTYPPKTVSAFMIAGGPGCPNQGYTFPKTLEETLRSKYDYRVHPKELGGSRDRILKHLDEYLDMMRARFEVAKDMLDEVDFLHVTIFYINVLHHFFYGENPSKMGWKLIDNYLGEFMGTGSNIILMSDHGTHPVSTVFYVNTWLQEEGYLKTKGSTTRDLYKIGISKENLLKIANRLKLSRLLKRIIPEKLADSIPSSDGTIAGLTGIPEDAIDWNGSKALATGQGTVYILSREDSDEYKRISRELIEKLENLKVPKSNLKVAKKIFRKEEVYSGKFLDIAPDIVYEQGRHVYTAPGIGRREYFSTSHRWKAENKREGIFLFYGDNIRKGLKVDNVRIVDLAPTILHLMNIPVPVDMDGRVLREIFKENSEDARRWTMFRKEDVEKKIENLKKSGRI